MRNGNQRGSRQRIGWAVLVWMSVCLLAPVMAQAQGGPFSARLAPVLLHSDQHDKVVGGLRFGFQYDRHWYSAPRPNAFRKGGYARAGTEGALAWKARYNPENLAASVDGGLSINLSRHTPTPFNPDDTTTAVVRPRNPYFGRLAVGASGRAETNQSFEEVNLSGGVRAAYTYIRNEGWEALIPSAVVEVAWVTPVESEVRDALALPDEAFPRLHLAASWNVPIGALLGAAPLRPLGLHIDTRYYKSWRLDPVLEAAHFDEAAYAAASLSYELVGRVPFVNEVFVRFSDGRLPPDFREDTFFFIGIVLSSRQAP